jgi:predicted GIY-YIG superfamily endonuclease
MKYSENNIVRCIYVCEFSDNNVYIGLTYDIEQRYKQHLTNVNSSVYKYILKNGLEPIIKQLTDYINKDEASKLEGVYKQHYIDNGWNILNIAQTGGLGGNNLKWTFEKCQEEALKYKTKTDFQKNNSSAYKSALKNVWLVEICSHMIKKEHAIYWTYEKCKEEALKYITRSDFYFKSIGAYGASVKNKWLNDICLHMIEIHKPKGYWTKEKCTEEASKYLIRSEFHKCSTCAYNSALRNNWLNDICSHMVKKQKQKV